ncbi:MAG: tetratricopeptide repeat protein [Desulfobulbaceae bacterium]
MKNSLKLQRSGLALLLFVMICGLFSPCLAGEGAPEVVGATDDTGVTDSQGGRPGVVGVTDGAGATDGQGRPSVASAKDGTGTTNIHDQFLEANRAYEAGDLVRAIGIYESLLDHAGFSASLCYNLANSYALDGQVGKAVLGYERALLLAPGDGDIRHNLYLLRQDKGLLQEDVHVLQQMGTLLGLNQWAALAAFFLVSLALLHLAALRFPVSTRTSSSLSGACLLLLGLCIAGVVVQYQHWRQAVVISPQSPVLISPFEGAGSTGVIEEGRLIRIMKIHNDYALIRNEQGRSGDGVSGWIHRSSIERIAVTMTDKKR